MTSRASGFFASASSTASGWIEPRRPDAGSKVGSTQAASNSVSSSALHTARWQLRATIAAARMPARMPEVEPFTRKNARSLPHSRAARSIASFRMPFGSWRSSKPSISVMSRRAPSAARYPAAPMLRLWPGMCIARTPPAAYATSRSSRLSSMRTSPYAPLSAPRPLLSPGWKLRRRAPPSAPARGVPGAPEQFREKFLARYRISARRGAVCARHAGRRAGSA